MSATSGSQFIDGGSTVDILLHEFTEEQEFISFDVYLMLDANLNVVFNWPISQSLSGNASNKAVLPTQVFVGGTNTSSFVLAGGDDTATINSTIANQTEYFPIAQNDVSHFRVGFYLDGNSLYIRVRTNGTPGGAGGQGTFYWNFITSNGEAVPQENDTGVGDLCKILSEDSGYQMFRNGLTMQWVSSPQLTSEIDLVVNFPTPFSAPPLKVVASTRFPDNDTSSEQWIQVVSWDASSATIRAQSQNAGTWTKPIIADIIAIGMAEVTGCKDSEGGEVAGTKISQLPSASSLKSDDLFVLSREEDSDAVYDISKNVTLEKLGQHVASLVPSNVKSDYRIIQTTYSFYIGGGSVCYPQNHIAGPGLLNGSVSPATYVQYIDILLKLGYIEKIGMLSVGPCFQMGAGTLWPAEEVQGYKITTLGRTPGLGVLPNPNSEAIDPRTGSSPKISILQAGNINNGWTRLYQPGDEGVYPYLSNADYTGGDLSYVPRAPTDQELMAYLNEL